MSRIIISGPDGKRGMLDLTRPLVSVGRGAANDLVLRDTSVSRFHAVIKYQNGKAFIADRNSTNGIVVGGHRIADEWQLRDNDVVRLGAYELRYEEVRDSGLLIKSADLLSSLNRVLRRGRSEELSVQVAGQVSGELTEQIKRLERENQLLSMLYDAGIALSSKLSLDGVSEQVMNLVSYSGRGARIHDVVQRRRRSVAAERGSLSPSALVGRGSSAAYHSQPRHSGTN